MKHIVFLAAALLFGGCTVTATGPAVPVAQVDVVGGPIEYYSWGGHYHYWHDNRWTVVDRVPEGRHWVAVDRQPARPLTRGNERPGEHREIERER